MSTAGANLRQQILHLWLHAAALDTKVAAWAFYDGTDGGHAPSAAPLPDDEPPYETGVDALRDGWMLLQAPGPLGTTSNAELGIEFVFERHITLA